METKKVCKRCGEINILDSSNLKCKEVFDKDGMFCKIMFYNCQRCGECCVVQIDNSETLKILRELKSLVIKVAKKNVKGESINKKYIRKKDRLHALLIKKRMELQNRCNGEKFFDENKKIVVEQLTFDDGGDIIEYDKGSL